MRRFEAPDEALARLKRCLETGLTPGCCGETFVLPQDVGRRPPFRTATEAPHAPQRASRPPSPSGSGPGRGLLASPRAQRFFPSPGRHPSEPGSLHGFTCQRAGAKLRTPLESGFSAARQSHRGRSPVSSSMIHLYTLRGRLSSPCAWNFSPSDAALNYPTHPHRAHY